MNDAVPEEPSADARQAARVFRDFYVSFVAEGFTEDQALKMLALMMANAHNLNDRDDE